MGVLETRGTGIALLIREARPDDAEALAGILNRIIEAGAYNERGDAL